MEIKLNAEKREKGEKLGKDFIAAVLYGLGVENKLLKIKTNDFIKVYSLAGESNLIKLDFDGQAKNVLVIDIQKDPVKNFVIHVDFYQVDMSRTVTAEIPFEFVGESKAIKELGGMLIKSLSELSVECLPGDLVDHIDVDISSIQELGQAIHVKDIQVPKGFKVLNHLDDPVATVVEPKEEKIETTEVKPAETAAAPEKKDEKSAQ